MRGWNGLLRLAGVPLCSGAASFVFFMVSGLWYRSKIDLVVLLGFGIIGAIAGFFIGCPIVLLVDWKWSRYKYRYVIVAVIGALLGWLLLEGAFAKNAWGVIWTNSYFWLEWAPRKVLIFSFIGLLSGLIYTVLVILINRFLPENKGEVKEK